MLTEEFQDLRVLIVSSSILLDSVRERLRILVRVATPLLLALDGKMFFGRMVMRTLGWTLVTLVGEGLTMAPRCCRWASCNEGLICLAKHCIA